jgi:PPOX class probable F420-dependent enzyme
LAKQRDAVKMTDAEAWRYIESQRDMHVATLAKDGSPHLTTNWFAIIDGVIAFTSYVTSQKIVNLQRDPRIAVLFADGKLYPELRGVSVKGTAVFVTDPHERDRVFAAIFERNKPYYGGLDTSVAQLAIADNKRVCVKVRAERMISWDHGKLG